LSSKAYGRRYAQAVFSIAQERKEIDLWLDELGKIAAVSRDKGLAAVLASPKFPVDAKTKLLSEKLGKISPLAFNLACLLVIKGSLDLAGNIVEEYEKLVNRYKGIEQAEVITAVPITDEDRGKLIKRLSALTGKKVLIKSRVDERLIGGIITRVGDKLIDGSVRNRLRSLKRDLEGSGV